MLEKNNPENSQDPTAYKHAAVSRRAHKGQAGDGCLFNDPCNTQTAVGRSTEVCHFGLVSLFFFFPELCFFFLWDFGFVLFCFFRVVAVHLLVTSEGADRFHFPELTTEPLK